MCVWVYTYTHTHKIRRVCPRPGFPLRHSDPTKKISINTPQCTPSCPPTLIARAHATTPPPHIHATYALSGRLSYSPQRHQASQRPQLKTPPPFGFYVPAGDATQPGLDSTQHTSQCGSADQGCARAQASGGATTHTHRLSKCLLCKKLNPRAAHQPHGRVRLRVAVRRGVHRPVQHIATCTWGM